MDNDYILTALMRERLNDMRAEAWVSAIRAAARPPRRPVRTVVGRLLVRLGNRLLAGVAPAQATA